MYSGSPFNFTSIAGNLPTAPALMGNVVVWKPASSAMLSAYYIVKLLEAAGLPPGASTSSPGNAAEISGIALASSLDLAGIHFTGSTAVFNAMWKTGGRRRGSWGRYGLVSKARGRDRRKGFHRSARLGRPAGAGGGDRQRRVRIPGSEVLGRKPRPTSRARSGPTSATGWWR